MGERLNGIQEVMGSSPTISTLKALIFKAFFIFTELISKICIYKESTLKRVLVRAHTNIMEPHSIEEVLAKDLFGHNPGNWLFLYGVLRSIVNDDVHIDFTTGYSEDLNPQRIKRYNQDYDYLLLPLANIFKEDWVEKLKALTFLVKALDIPCIVVGMGLQSDVEDGNFDFPFNKTATRFINAVLQKSSIIGIRGEYTARYLEYLGYRRDEDFMVIGCPSMYSFGTNLPRITMPAIKPKRILINTNPTIQSVNYNLWFKHFIDSLDASQTEYFYLPQRLDELRLIQYGTSMAKHMWNKVPDYFPVTTKQPLYQHEVGVNSVESWLALNRTMDLTIGSRIHGCIASILCGVPSLLLSKDSRTKELATFFGLPFLDIADIHENFDIIKYCETLDYSKIYELQEINFKNYLRFLDLNHVTHIYQENPGRSDIPYDRISQNNAIQIYYPVTSRDPSEVSETLLSYTEYLQDHARRSEKEYRHKLLSLYTTIYKQSFSIKKWKRQATAEKKDTDEL